MKVNGGNIFYEGVTDMHSSIVDEAISIIKN